MRPNFAQLRSLQSQTGARRAGNGAAAPARTKRPGPQDTRALRQMLRLRAPGTAPARASAAQRSLPGREIAPGLRRIETSQPAADLPFHLDGAFDRRGAFNPRRALFFDTETTGLAGGAGTRAFLIGAAAWRDGRLHVRQLLTTTLAAETALLATFASWLAPATLLVSYNGKSYDAPLLRTRCRLARLPDPMTGRAHIDLLHPSRRRYRDQLVNCRLATIESEVLGITRAHDLPGSEAPAAWRTYLRGGPADDLRRIIEHNRQDVASLAQLLLQLGNHPDNASQGEPA